METSIGIATHKRDFEKHTSSHQMLAAIRRGEFDEHGLVYKSPLHKLIWWWTFETIFALLGLRKEDRVLNVGIGFGSDEKVIKARLPGISLYGIDISSNKIVGSLLNSTPAVIAVAAAEELPLSDNAFTRIVSREVMEHVLDPDLFLRQIRRVATPGSVVVITTPNGDSLAFTHLLYRIGLHSKRDYKDEHMTSNQLEELFVSCGFEIRDRFFDCAGYFWLSWLFSTPLGPLAPILAKATRPLEGCDLLSRLMCDQVKYVLIPQKTDKDGICQEATKVAWVCPKCKGALSQTGTTLKCSRCDAIYGLIDGKAPVFLADSIEASVPQQNQAVKRRNSLARQFVKVAYSLVYGPALLLATAVALVLSLFGRSSNPVRN